MARLTPRFSADRAVREYTEQHYLPGAATYRERAADKGAVGRQMVDWQHALEKEWPALRFGEVKVGIDGEQHAFEVQVYLNDVDPNAARVELGLGASAWRNFRRIRYGIILEPRSSAATNWASEKYIRPVEADIIAMMRPSSIQWPNRRRIP